MPCRSRLAAALLAPLLLLASCGDLPQPFRGRPGGNAPVLLIPLAMRLAVPPPAEALLPDAAAMQYAEALADALQAQDVPATAIADPRPLDWRLAVSAAVQGGSVTPRYRMLNADGQEQAAMAGEPVPLDEWSNPNPELFRRLAAEAAPRLTQLLLQVEAARKSTDPAALAGGPPRLRFTGVTGAPGDGNASLALRMREFLGQQGYVMQEVADGAAYALEGRVQMVPTGRLQRVEILWIVSRRDGEELGRVLQMNEVPAGSLNGLWGDVAYVVAQEASGGIRQVIQNATEPTPAAPPAEAATAR